MIVLKWVFPVSLAVLAIVHLVSWIWIVVVCVIYAAGAAFVYANSRRSIPRALRPLALAYMLMLCVLSVSLILPLPTESELAEQYGLRKTNVHLGLQELERLGFLKVVPRHATYVAPYWEQANLETLAAIMTHGGKPQPELVDAFLELREMVALGWFRWTGRNPKTEQMRHLYGLLERMEAIAYAPDGEKDNPKFLDLVNQFLVCMFAESDNMIFRVLLRSSRELAHVTYYIVAYTLDTQELCKTYRTVLDGLTSGHASEAIDYWCGWSDRVTVQYREALLQLGSE